jgi:GAF domain-containing protein
VHSFPGHIACSSLSNSEIVVPLCKNGQVMGVLDVDSTKHADFDDEDRHYLEEIVRMLLSTEKNP